MKTRDKHAPDTGSLIGPWRILERMGSGTFGIVYRVCLAENPGAGEYALKLARYAGDLRFEREGELLSRIHHPHVPGWRDHGVWQGSQRGWYPYIVMQWVEGLPLHLWAKQRGVTSRQALRILGQVARALEATHQHGVHRDVKGDNVLVTSEGDAVLVDFGCCWYEGARPLTEGGGPPGTWPYRSPQALRHEREANTAERYVGTPADDVYALGMTAYHLVTGTYPLRDSEDAPRLLPPSELATVAPVLEALILRMLSEYPSVRGTAGELAEALEQAEKSSGPVADERVRPSRSMLPTERALRPGPTRWQLARQVLRQAVRQHSVALRVAGTLAVCLLVALALPPLHEWPARLATVEQEAQADASVEERTVGLADAGVDDSVLAAAQAHAYRPQDVAFGEPIPEKPEPGQKQPPCNNPDQRAINGGCWVPITIKPPCQDFYEHDGRCYAPVPQGARRPPTSKEP
jgi:serine/threonine protein kinase